MTGDGWAKGSDGIWAKGGQKAQLEISTTAGNKRRETTQEILQSQGYRPVVKKLVDEKKFPTPAGLFTIGDLGGWSENSDKFFGEDGIVTGLEEKLGVPTE